MVDKKILRLRAKLGVRIRDLRKRNGHSQERFADICGLHRTYIGSVERGERNISFDNIVRIADSLGVAPSDLLRDL